jgi:hypothetical protein
LDEPSDSFHSIGFKVKLRLSKERYLDENQITPLFASRRPQMFCPQCGNEILSERVRFCTRCSFPLTTVKELVVNEATKTKPEEEKKNFPLRQQDISIGAGLMSIGLVKAMVMLSAFVGSGKDHELFILTLTLGLFFGAILMFSQLSPRQRGLTLGATMIFLGSLICVAAGLIGGGPPALLTIVGISLLISLFWVRLTGAFTRLFFDKGPTHESPNQAPFQPVFKAVDTAQPLLPQMQSSAVVEINLQEVKTKQLVQPSSITEDTTSLLNMG